MLFSVRASATPGHTEVVQVFPNLCLPVYKIPDPFYCSHCQLEKINILQQINILQKEELKTNEQQEPVFTSQDIYNDGELLFSTEIYVNK